MSLRSKPLGFADELRLLCSLGNRCLLFMLLRDKPLEDLAPPESYLALDAGGSARGAAQKNQTSPLITLMTLIYTDQNAGLRCLEGEGPLRCFSGQPMIQTVLDSPTVQRSRSLVLAETS